MLRADRLRLEGRGRLEVRLATDEDGERETARFSRSGGALEIPLTGSSRAAVRLSLAAVSDGRVSASTAKGWDATTELAPAAELAAEVAGVVLSKPAIWSPPGGLAAVLSAPPPGPGPLPPVIMYLIDTLRPDHLGCYGYPKPVSPNIDRFAEDAVLFEYAVGQSSWTRPSVASIFTGLWPKSHGAVATNDKLPGAHATMAELLSAAGYQTAAVFTNPNVSTAFGFDQGFHDLFELVREGQKRAVEVVAEAERWIGSRPRDAPFFLYLHTQEPHSPYLPAEPFRRRWAPGATEVLEMIRKNPLRERWPPTDRNREQLQALYDAEIAANDAAFGRLVGFLKSRRLYDRSIVIVVSDHGEEFYEHRRWGHRRNLHVEELNVALLIKLPGQKSGRRVAAAVQHTDLLPTLLDLLGLETPAPVEGRSLARHFEEAPLFSHTRLAGNQLSVVAGNYKLIQHWKRGSLARQSLYDWRRDPRERNDLLASRPITAAVLATLLKRRLAERAPAAKEEATLDDELRERLRALGYL